MQLPLKDFLEFKWGIRDRIVLDLKSELDSRILEAIRSSGELNEALAHIQIEEAAPTIVSIWRPNEWRTAYSKWIEDKAKAEVRLAEHDAEKECILYITGLIIIKFGEVVGAQMAPTMAEDIVKKKKTNSAMMFGAEKERLSWQ